MEKLNNDKVRKILNDCRKATFLVEKQQSEKITAEEEIELQLHLKGCDMCRIFMKQSALINQFAKKLVGSAYNELRLEDGFKEQLQKRIDKKMDTQ
ncbi:hypothetical protein [Olivibacter sp. XZL3]|uniref:hypothetical protein n=1 Tax=Olivibacter sp. XZL3 TaxID=1735116 RepID=UPI001066FB1B|nr:hypothetical protein [Olivibacter sp. XZL3]